MTQQQALAILKTGRNVFLTGEPGAGKTYTINQFTEWLRGGGRQYAITASTGIAATHINGQTIHSWSGLGIARDLTDQLMDKIVNSRNAIERMMDAEVLIIDEVSMLDAHFIDMLDAVLKNIRMNNFPFGGIQVVFVGDFYQLAPVVKDQKTRYAFESGAWKAAYPVVCYLSEQHRQSDPEFLDILTSMRKGTVTGTHIKRLTQPFDGEVPKTQLFTHNADVDIINSAELNKLTGEPRVYRMRSEAVHKKLEWIIDDLKKQCLSPEKLVVKEGSVVMFTRNKFDPDTGEAIYVNGSLGEVIGFSELSGHPRVKLYDGSGVVVPDFEKWVREDKNGEALASITQIPLRLAWAITVHKSQGMSLDSATVDLTKAFAYGQGYVAISRVRSLDGLNLRGMNDQVFMMDPVIVQQDKIFREQSEANEAAYGSY